MHIFFLKKSGYNSRTAGVQKHFFEEEILFRNPGKNTYLWQFFF